MTNNDDIQISSVCALCGKSVCVSLYIRVKPWTGKSKDFPKGSHKFFGFWPPESHLLEYLKVEASKHSLQRWYNENCRGHTINEIVAAIENTIPPIPGLPIRIMWNPATQVVAYLQAETLEQKRKAKMDIQSSIRVINVYQVSEVKSSIITLFNNTVPQQVDLSLPNSPVKVYSSPTSMPSEESIEGELVRLRKQNQALLKKLTRQKRIKRHG